MLFFRFVSKQLKKFNFKTEVLFIELFYGVKIKTARNGVSFYLLEFALQTKYIMLFFASFQTALKVQFQN